MLFALFAVWRKWSTGKTSCESCHGKDHLVAQAQAPASQPSGAQWTAGSLQPSPRTMHTARGTRGGHPHSGTDLSAAKCYLCPDLIVPENCECVLLVPFGLPGASLLKIQDGSGKPVLFLEP